MKKNGFTLAEVLITLAIIGVIATMTLPSLMTNTQEQQAKTGLKKAINTLSNAAEMNAAATGFDYVSITSVSTDDAESQSLFGILANRTQVDYGKTGANKPGDQTSTIATVTNWVTFRDGSSVGYLPSETKVSDTNAVLQADGLPLGFSVVFDTNGAKAPNIVSNCKTTARGVTSWAADDDATNGIIVGGGAAGGATGGAESTEGGEGGEGGTDGGSTVEATGANVKAACPKASRVIKDQFIIQLRGTVAQPRGAAATWAYID